MKKVLVFLASFTLFFIISNTSVSAAKLISVWEEGGNVLVNQTKGAYYYAAKDVIYVDFYGSRLKKGEIQYYHDSAYTQKGAYNERTAVDGAWIVGVQLSCTGYYEVKEYYSDGRHAITLRVQVEQGDLKQDKCLSDHDEPSEEEILQTACSTKICECIADLKASTDSVKESVEKVVTEMKQLNQTTTEIKGVLEDFSNEFKTDLAYDIKPFPDTSDLLEQNKPQQNEKPFIDNNTYFTDPGDDPNADPGKLPSAPGVKDWDGFLPELPMPPEKENSKEPDKVQEPENNMDLEQQPDREMLPDKQQQEPEMQLPDFKPSPEMKPDKHEQDKQQIKDSETSKDSQMVEQNFSQDNKFGSTNNYDKTHEYQQTNNFGSGGN